MNQFLGSIALLPVERLVNAIVARDSHIAGKVSSFDGKCVEVICSKPYFTLSLRFEDAKIRLGAIDSATLGTTPDATITGPLEKLLGLLLPGAERRALADAGIDISGDATLVQDLHRMIESLDVDWQDYLTPLFGDVISHELGEMERQIRGWSMSAGDSLQRSIRDYLSDEARLAPSALEVDSFSNRLDHLRLSVDRTAARTELIGRRIQLLGN